MEPRIQYAQTADGVSIAYWTLGEGMPLVHMPAHPWSHIQVEWQMPELRSWYERRAEKAQPGLLSGSAQFRMTSTAGPAGEERDCGIGGAGKSERMKVGTVPT